MSLHSRRKQLAERNLEIYKAHIDGEFSYSELKKRYGLSRGRIGQIVNEIRDTTKGKEEARGRGY